MDNVSTISMSGIIDPPKIIVATLTINHYRYALSNLIPHTSVVYGIDCFNDTTLVKSITGLLEGEQYKEWTTDDWLDRFIKQKVEELPDIETESPVDPVPVETIVEPIPVDTPVESELLLEPIPVDTPVETIVEPLPVDTPVDPVPVDTPVETIVDPVPVNTPVESVPAV